MAAGLVRSAPAVVGGMNRRTLDRSSIDENRSVVMNLRNVTDRVGCGTAFLLSSWPWQQVMLHQWNPLAHASYGQMMPPRGIKSQRARPVFGSIGDAREGRSR